MNWNPDYKKTKNENQSMDKYPQKNEPSSSSNHYQRDRGESSTPEPPTDRPKRPTGNVMNKERKNAKNYTCEKRSKEFTEENWNTWPCCDIAENPKEKTKKTGGETVTR